MKDVKNAKTELERQLEEELRRESEANAHEESADAGAETESDADEVVAAEAVSDAAAEANESPATPIEQLEQDLEDAREQLLRMRAEFDNYLKRMAREADRMRKRAAESLLLDLLPVMDNLELALKHADAESGSLAEGVSMVLKQLASKLEGHGLKPIPAVGQPFDPRIHEAVSQKESAEFPRDTVAEEFQKGYLLGDQVLRASKVAVSMGAPANAAASDGSRDGNE